MGKGGYEKGETRRFKEGFGHDKGWAYSNLEPAVMHTVIELHPQPFKRALDVGAGFGRHSFDLLRKVANEVIASDASKEQVGILQREVERNGYKNVTVLRHDMSSIPLKDESCDLLVHWDVLAHGNLHEIQDAMNEAHRVLEKDGYLVLSTLSTSHPNYGKGTEVEPNTFKGGFEGEWGNPHHYFTENELRFLLRGFDIIEMKEKRREFGYNRGGVHWEIIAKRK